MLRNLSLRKSIARRILIFLVTIVTLISAAPLEPMAAFLESSRLTYQELSTDLAPDGSESVALNGMIPLNTEMIVQRSDASTEDSLCAYDITLSKNGKEYQPGSASPLNVEIKNKIIGESLASDHELHLWHIHDDGEREEITDFEIVGDSIFFKASGFSIYEVIEDDPPRQTYTFYAPDEKGESKPYYFTLDSGDITCQQVIKSGEKLIVPQLPASGHNDSSTFIGWFEYKNGVKQSDKPFDFNVAPVFTDSSEIELRALYSNCAYVIFHEQKNSNDVWPITATRRGEIINGQTTIKIDDISVSYEDNKTYDAEHPAPSSPQMIFRGWSKGMADPGKTPDEGILTGPLVIEDKTTGSNYVDLYPVFTDIRWLQFNTGEDGNYIAPKYYYLDDGADSLPVPTRAGYVFAGWKTKKGTKLSDAKGNIVNSISGEDDFEIKNGHLIVKKDAELTAVWTPATSQYTVMIWQQKATDEVNGEKHYDYAESFVLDATTETSVSVSDTYTKLEGKKSEFNELIDYTGFYFSNCDNAKIVKGDGSTVLNVYYNRNVHTFSFYKNNDGSLGSFITSFSALYGHNVKDYFPIVVGSKTYDTNAWKQVAKSKDIIYPEALVTVESMPDKNVNFRYYDFSTTVDKTIYYYVEIDASEYDASKGDRIFKNKYYTLHKSVKHRFRYITYDEEYHTILGYDKSLDLAEPDFYLYNNVYRADFIDNKNYLYYDRIQKPIDFYDKSDHLGSVQVYYTDKIANNVIADPEPPSGYEFGGWCIDPGCTTRVFFTEPTQEEINSTKDENGIPHYQVYERMPANSLIFYAKWVPVKYLVELDPNGGVLAEGEKTWYWENYMGDPIKEYSTASRNFEPSVDGTYYYRYYDYPNREIYGFDENGDPVSSNTGFDKKYAQYVTDIGSATDLSQSYAPAENAYKYVGWYKVDPETGEETVYKFGEPVTENTKLVLHWKQIGTYFIKYEPGEGNSLDDTDNNNSTFEQLELAEYTDNSSVVVTRVAQSGKGENFIGWRIRNDDSERIYYPGEAFAFNSKFAEIGTVGEGDDAKEGKCIILDAVYASIDTAKIVYDANGGTVSDDADYGGPTSTPPFDPETSHTASSATISNLLNNSEVRLSNGKGFTNGYTDEDGKFIEYTFCGWNTEPDGSGTHFAADGIYNVDTNDPVTLYAEWKIKVYFDKNNPACEWDAAWNTDGNGYFYDSDREQYYTEIMLNSVLSEPEYPMKSSKEDERFWYWGTDRYKEKSLEYDFSKPVTSEMTLYGYWGELIKVPLHVIDASEEELQQVDNWRKNESIEINNDTSFSLDNKHTDYVNVPTNYKYAFTCIAKDSTEISESNAVTNISYNSKEKCVWLTYADGSEGAMPSEYELYFIYFKSPEDLPIGYVELASDGTLTNVTVKNTAPKNADTDPYSMNGKITAPLSYPSDKTYNMYSYAIGDKDASDASKLHIITEVQTSNNSRPNLQFRKTWRGYQYSTDNGSTWINCGYDIQPYVVYYETKPVIVNLSEKTIGLAEDMDEEFTYKVVIEEITETTVNKMKKGVFSNNWSIAEKISSDKNTKTISPNDYSVLLSDSDRESFTLFYSSNTTQGETYSENWTTYRNDKTITTYQRIKIVQTPKTDFVTDNNGSGASHTNNLTYTFTTANGSKDQQVTFTNTHTPVPVELHVALVQNGEYTPADSLRTNNDSIYIQNVAINDKVELSQTSPNGLFTGDPDDYVFAGIIYGTLDENGNIIRDTSVDSVSKVTYDKVQGDQIYDICINGDKTKPIGDGEIFYLYYRKPKVVYVKEGANGVLTRIDPLEMNGSNVTLNGTTVTQDALLPLGDDGLHFIQSGMGFKVPPKLDDAVHGLQSLSYAKIGVGGDDVTSIGGLTDVSENKELYIGMDGIQPSFRFNASDDWNPFTSDPVVYVIYKETGYELNITKSVESDSEITDDEYTIEIRSAEIKNTSYTISGYSTDSIEAVPASGGNDGIIRLTMHNGSNVTITGLPKGIYTVSETNLPNNCTMTALFNGNNATVNNDSFTFELNKDSKADITNSLKTIIAPTGFTASVKPFMLLLLASAAAAVIVIWLRKRREVITDEI